MTSKGILQQVFRVLHARKPGAPVTGYVFTFRKEEGQLTIDQGVDEIRKQKDKKSITKNRFNNFEQRQYDYDELEKQLLRAQGNISDDEKKK